MGTITHVFFGLHGTLARPDRDDPARPYERALGRYLAARYGGDRAEWIAAHRRILEDWDSYFADLDLGAEDGLDQMWEGETRVMRALFRLAGRPCPSPEEMARLVREYHYPVASQIDSLYPDAHEALRLIRHQPLVLGVISHRLSGYVAGVLAGAGVREWFTGPVITPDVMGYCFKDEGYFRLAFARAGAAPEVCVVVDDKAACTAIAAALGARTVLVDRAGRHAGQAGTIRLPDLGGLPDVCRSL